MKKTAIMFGTVHLYANLQTRNVKVGSRAPAVPVGELYGSMSKGSARALRKQFRAAGLTALAAAPRPANVF
jgi:hypothetical protein